MTFITTWLFCLNFIEISPPYPQQIPERAALFQDQNLKVPCLWVLPLWLPTEAGAGQFGICSCSGGLGANPDSVAFERVSLPQIQEVICQVFFFFLCLGDSWFCPLLWNNYRWHLLSSSRVLSLENELCEHVTSELQQHHLKKEKNVITCKHVMRD